MIKVIRPKRNYYAEIVKLVNDADKVFFDIYTAKEAKEIGVANETEESLIKGESNRNYLILKYNDRIVAFVSFRLKNPQTVWISSLYVDNNHQRKGFGCALLNEVEQIAKNQDAKVVVCETEIKAKWAVNFYIKCGYSILKKEDLNKYPFDQVLDKELVSNRYIFGKVVNN